MTSQQQQQQTQEQGSNVFRLELPANMQFLSIVGACLNDLLRKANNVEDLELISYDIQLAVQELCTNIVRHAYEDQSNNERIRITIVFYNYPRRVSIELEDSGKFFDEVKVEEPNLEEGQVHGYGLFLIKNLMDEVTYTRNASSNSWHLVKNLEEAVKLQ